MYSHPIRLQLLHDSNSTSQMLPKLRRRWGASKRVRLQLKSCLQQLGDRPRRRRRRRGLPWRDGGTQLRRVTTACARQVLRSRLQPVRRQGVGTHEGSQRTLGVESCPQRPVFSWVIVDLDAFCSPDPHKYPTAHRRAGRSRSGQHRPVGLKHGHYPGQQPGGH